MNNAKCNRTQTSQAIYKQQSAESLLIPNQQSANLLKLEHTGTHRFQYLYVRNTRS